MTDNAQFNPDWISPPGETIEELLDELGWKQTDLAKRMGVSPPFVNELVKGKAPITTDTAELLSRVLGSTPNFWLVRDAQYQAGLKRKEAIEAAKKNADWLKELPLPWMKKWGLISDIRSRGELVLDSLSFFGVASVKAWREQYAEPLVAFRASEKFGKKIGSVAAWLRGGERIAGKIQCAPFDKQAFRSALDELRKLTNEPDPKVFIPRMTDICAGCGVAVVFLEAPKGCPASGATRWLAPDKALLLLSLRHGSNDHLWFSFFHEAAHLLLHGKKLIFIEGLEGLDSQAEKEADTYAGNFLINPGDLKRLLDLISNKYLTKEEVCVFADEIGLPPGIVVGRIQKIKGRYDYMTDLKVFYAWAEKQSDNG